MSDDFELGGEAEMEPTSSVTFSSHFVLREVWDGHRRTGEHLCVFFLNHIHLIFLNDRTLC